MNKKQHILLMALLALLAALNLQLSTVFAQGTAFTYQGRLTVGGNSSTNGTYDFLFQVFDAALVGTGTSYGSPNPNSISAVAVSNGLFTVTLDFGSLNNPFIGPARWLEISVRTNGVGSYTTLNPRQQLTPVPYAITAGNVTGPVPAAQLNGQLPSGLLAGTYGSSVTLNNAGNSFTGNGAGLTGVNALSLGGLSANQFWKLAGNSGTTPGLNFVGTTDNQPLELKANSQRGLRLEPNLGSGAPNFIGGSPANYVTTGAVGAAIGGGGGVGYVTYEPALGGFFYASSNSIFADLGTICGGGVNLIQTNSNFATITGGALNTIQTNSRNAVIGGGLFNTIQTNSPFATIAGGLFNSAAGIGAFVGGGGYDGNFIPAPGNSAGGSASAIVGGIGNTIPTWDHYSFIGGGFYNQISPLQGIFAANTLGATIGGGGQNTTYGSWATIPGGLQNVAQGSYSFAAGQNAKALQDGTFVWADDSSTSPFSSTAANQFLIRANGGVGININNPTDAALSIAGKVRLNDNNIYFRSGEDTNHGLGYYYGTKSFAGNTTLDGPVLFGYGGGILGTENFGAEHIALQWSPTSVSVYGTFNNNSDRNAKQDFTPISPSRILDKVLQLAVSGWSYKVDATTHHIGPMAQDFYSTFNIGTDDKHIAPIDEGGVALAAIQGLNQKLQDELNYQDAENTRLKRQNDSLTERLSELEVVVRSITEKK